MALTKEDLQAIGELIDAKLEPIIEQQEVNTKVVASLDSKVTSLDSKVTSLEGEISHISQQQDINTRTIIRLENSIMHELKLLNENLPDAVARNEKLRDLETTVDNHDHRIFVLEQNAANV